MRGVGVNEDGHMRGNRYYMWVDIYELLELV